MIRKIGQGRLDGQTVNSVQQILIDTFHVAGAWLYRGFRDDFAKVFVTSCTYILSRLMSYCMFSVRKSLRISRICVWKDGRNCEGTLQDKGLHKGTEVRTSPAVGTVRTP